MEQPGDYDFRFEDMLELQDEHDREVARMHPKSDRAVVCKHWLKGLCKKRDFCEFLHVYDLSRMPECWFFSRYGECNNDECLYLHITEEDKVNECPWYQRGFCKHGNRCRNKHVRRALCQNYYLGFCPDGPNCKFGHPKYHLPPLDEDRKRMLIRCHNCGQLGHKVSLCPLKRTFIH